MLIICLLFVSLCLSSIVSFSNVFDEDYKCRFCLLRFACLWLFLCFGYLWWWYLVFCCLIRVHVFACLMFNAILVMMTICRLLEFICMSLIVALLGYYWWWWFFVFCEFLFAYPWLFHRFDYFWWWFFVFSLVLLACRWLFHVLITFGGCDYLFSVCFVCMSLIVSYWDYVWWWWFWVLCLTCLVCLWLFHVLIAFDGDGSLLFCSCLHDFDSFLCWIMFDVFAFCVEFVCMSLIVSLFHYVWLWYVLFYFFVCTFLVVSFSMAYDDGDS